HLRSVPPTSVIYTLSLHDALPIYHGHPRLLQQRPALPRAVLRRSGNPHPALSRFAGEGSDLRAPCPWSSPCHAPSPVLAPSPARSEEHTSELQSRENLVCRLLLEK